MFASAFIFLFLSLFSCFLGFSDLLDWGLSMVSIAAAVLFLVVAMVALPSKQEPRSTCFIYPTFSCAT